MEDKLLLEKCKKGDIEAYEMLVKKYMKKAYNVALYFTKNPADAWDISQEGFISAWKGIKNFDTKSPFSPWLYTIIKNKALAKLKKEKREVIEEELPLKIASPEENLEKKEEIMKLKEALLKLDEEKRQIIYLRHYAEMSYKEISIVLNLPIGTVMSRLYYARKALLEEFKKIE
ncbi:MAG: sigma-70 family RNA polymerase sigma factor [candidate division WOR-3 bacterium]